MAGRSGSINVIFLQKYGKFCIKKLSFYRNINKKLELLLLLTLQPQEDLWLKVVQELENIIKSTIEFAKMLPGFLRLNQDDQIVLLKKGVYLVLLTGSYFFQKNT